MRVLIIGSTQYRSKMKDHAKKLEAEGHAVSMPAFDDHSDFNELELCRYNLRRVKEADEIHIMWDQRSFGTMFDFGMAFALGKPIKVVFLETKTFANVLRMYEREKNK